MGASLDTPARVPSVPSVCPLCHRESRNPVTLICTHCFCRACIAELWSGSPSGPYYCPECRHEYRKLPAFAGNLDGPSTSAGRYATGWRLGERLSLRYSSSGLLRKRAASSSDPGQSGGGQRLGSASSSNSAVTVSDDSSDSDEPPVKKTLVAVTPPARDAPPQADTSPGRGTSPARSTSSVEETPRARQSLPMQKTPPARGTPLQKDSPPVVGSPAVRDASPMSETTLPRPASPIREAPAGRQSSSVTATPPKGETSPRKKISSTRTPSPGRETPSVSGSPPASGSGPPRGSPPDRGAPTGRDTPTGRDKPPGKDLSPGNATVSPDVGTSGGGPVACHYCPSPGQKPAVKTCLVCGASMCPEHLRVHLKSPVFQSHPLVPAVDDMSPWRCQEHQEMNRIYCRPCRVCVCTVCTVIGSHRDHTCISIREAERELRDALKDEVKKIHEDEQIVLQRVAALMEKKRAAQEVVGEARTSVQHQYQAMREALEQEEQQALRCVAQEESRVLGGVQKQLGLLNGTLSSIQSRVRALEGLADAKGVSRVQDQAFIMEYTKSLSGMSSPVEDLEPPQEVDRARLGCLQEWTERRLDTVVVSLPHRDPFRLLYGISPTLDPDTAHPKLLLSEEDRQVTYSEAQQPYPELEARFSSFPQVLGSRALEGGCCYWEVKVSVEEGRWKVGVCEGQIGRKGQKDACRMGFNPHSWCLLSEKGKIEALHDKAASPVCATGLQSVGVLLNFEEGSLSFFSVAEEGALTLLYSFQHTFPQPLYPALAVSKTQLTICDLFHRVATD